MLITATQAEAATLSLPFSHLSSLETSQVIFRPTAALVKVRVVHKCAEKYFTALSLINAALQTSCFICRVTLMVA